MESKENTVVTKPTTDRNFKIKAGIFLGSVGIFAGLVGFSKTVASAKREEHKFVQETVAKQAHLLDDGARLALRALGWGTLYAVFGTGTLCYGIWKLSGAKDFQEFRQKVGSMLPKISSKDLATSRTEFDDVSDLLKYISTWGKE